MKKKVYITMILSTLLLNGCALPGLSGPSDSTIKVGTLGTSESEIMGAMVEEMVIHYTDLNVEQISNLGSSIVQHRAVVDGEVDITATRYTGTDMAGALDMIPIKDPEEALTIVQEEFDSQFNQTWIDSYGFDNSYAVAVTKTFAEENDIETVSDLEPYAEELRFGVDNNWVNREGDGYEGFQESYDFSFGEVYPMQIGLVYQAAANGNMDVVLAYSSDGRVREFDLKVLEDDRQFFPPYDTSSVIRNEIIEENPEMAEILNKLAGTITTEMMQEMNYRADVELEDPRMIAVDFLEENNYFEGGEE